MGNQAVQGGITKDGYFEAYGLAEDTLLAEREYFKSKARNYSLSPAERAGAVAVAAAINSKLMVLQAQYDAFSAQYDGEDVDPPPQKMLQRSADLAAALARDLTSAVQGTAVLDIINDFFKKWTMLLRPSAPDATAAGNMPAPAPLAAGA
jgi:hypothetical protein